MLRAAASRRGIEAASVTEPMVAAEMPSRSLALTSAAAAAIVAAAATAYAYQKMRQKADIDSRLMFLGGPQSERFHRVDQRQSLGQVMRCVWRPYMNVILALVP